MGGGGGAGGDDNRKQNHCEIEKRRRDKMNHYITELASVIPAFNNNQSKLDKLTVLRMAVQHVKSLRSSLCSFSSFHLRPSFLSSGNLLKNLILQMASQEAQDNLFMVVTCDRGKVLFVSESSKNILNQDQHELVGQSLFDILHKDDVSKVKEQISYFNLMPKEMLVDSKTLQPIKNNQRESFIQLQNHSNSTLQPGSRRSFFCRMKCGRIWPPPEKLTSSSTTTTANTTSKQISSNKTTTSQATNTSNSNKKSQRDLPATTLQTKPNTSETMSSNKNQQNTKRHHKSSLCHGKRIERHHHHHHQISSRGRHQKEFKQLANSSESDEAKYSHVSRAMSSSSSLEPSSSSHGHNSSDSGNSSAATVRKQLNKSTRITHAGPDDDAPIESETKMSQEMVCSDGRVAAVEFGARRNGGGGSVVENKNAKSTRTKHPCDDHGIRLSSSLDVVSNKQTTSSSGGDMESQESCLSGDASQGTASNDNAQRSTSANESSPLSTTSSSSSAPSLFSTNAKNNNKDNVRCKARRTIGKTSQGGCGASSALSTGNNIGSSNVAISFNRKQWRYIVMHCTGYLKSITVRNDEYDDDDDDADFEDRANGDNLDDEDDTDDGHSSDSQFKTINCLVAVCRRSVMDRYLKPDRPLTFTCRYSMEGKFTFVDQRTTVALGYMPQQLVGTSHYAYCHEDSVNTFKECHRKCILNSETVSSDIYQFRRANGQNLWLQTSLKSFRNPWTKLIDYIVANHTTAEGSDPKYNEGCVPTKFNQDMTRGTSQSSSPASSSSISCLDSKKSTSPSSSSIGSSYSMDSYASGANIQALLNQIDRVKSGSWQHPLKSNKRRVDSHHHAVGSSGGSSARKSNDDSGNYSDLQSCSSISSQNSGASSTGNGHLNMQTGSKLQNNSNTTTQEQASNNHPIQQQQSQQHQQQSQQHQQQLQHQQQQQSQEQEHQSHQQQQQIQQQSQQHIQQQNQQPQQQPTQMLASDDASATSYLNDEYNYDQAEDVFSNEPANPGQAVYQQPNVANRQQICDRGDFNGSASSLPRQPDHVQFLNTETCKNLGGPRMISARLSRPPVNSTSAIKPLQRPYLYSYRAPPMSQNEINPSNIHVQRSSWVTNSAANYTNSLRSHQSDQEVTMEKNETEQQRRTSVRSMQGGNQMINKIHDEAHLGTYGVQQRQQQLQQQPHQQIQQQRQQQHVSLIQAQVSTRPSQASENFDSHLGELTYLNELIQPINHFMTPGAIEQAHYTTEGININDQLGCGQRVTTRGHLRDDLTTMTLSQQQQTSQQQQSTQGTNHQDNIDMSVPMIWNSAGSSYQAISTMHNSRHHQMTCHRNNGGTNSNNIDGENGDNVNLIGMNVIETSNNQMNMVGHQINQCQQCADAKSSCPAQNQQMIMNNSGDLNSTHLSSLAVDDLDESELLECLAACDPDVQLYDIQNNTYSTQYNIYRE